MSAGRCVCVCVLRVCRVCGCLTDFTFWCCSSVSHATRASVGDNDKTMPIICPTQMADAMMPMIMRKMV